MASSGMVFIQSFMSKSVDENIEELHNLYASQNIVKMIKSRRMRWAGNIERMGDIRNVYKILVETLEGRDHSEY
jgi:hypothetical protein